MLKRTVAIATAVVPSMDFSQSGLLDGISRVTIRVRLKIYFISLLESILISVSRELACGTLALIAKLYNILLLIGLRFAHYSEELVVSQLLYLVTLLGRIL